MKYPNLPGSPIFTKLHLFYWCCKYTFSTICLILVVPNQYGVLDSSTFKISCHILSILSSKYSRRHFPILIIPEISESTFSLFILVHCSNLLNGPLMSYYPRLIILYCRHSDVSNSKSDFGFLFKSNSVYLSTISE